MHFIKKLNKLVLVVCFCTFIGSSVQVRASDTLSLIRTGVSALDIVLNEFSAVNPQTKQATSIIYEITSSYNLSQAIVQNLLNKGFNLGEIYYIALLHQSTGKSITEILRMKTLLDQQSGQVAGSHPGRGWGVLAHQLGVHPSTLNKNRVAAKKKHAQKKSFSGLKASDEKTSEKKSLWDRFFGSDDDKAKLGKEKSSSPKVATKPNKGPKEKGPKNKGGKFKGGGGKGKKK